MSTKLVIDFETAGFDGEVIGMGYYDFSSNTFSFVKGQDKVINFLKANLNKKLVVHNAKFDVGKVMKRLGFSLDPNQVWDTMVAAHSLNSSLPSYSLDNLTGQKTDLLGVLKEAGYTYSKLDEFWHSYADWKSNIKISQIVEDYCLADVKATLWLFKKQSRILSLDRKWLEAVKADMKFWAILAEIETNGVTYDKQAHDSLKGVLEAELDCINKSVVFPLCPEKFHTADLVSANKQYKPHVNKKTGEITPRKVNGVYHADCCPVRPFSPTRANDILFLLHQSGFDIHCLPKTKAGAIKTGKAIIGSLALSGAAAHLARMQQLQATLSRLSSLLSFVEKDGKIHSQFLQTGTITGRLASIDPNIQNLPRPTSPFGKELRQLFIPAPGKTMTVMDLDRIEVVVLAYYLALLGDTGLVKTIEGGLDIHSYNAAAWGVARDAAKILLFSIIYGATWMRIVASGVAKTRKEAEAMLDGVAKGMPGFPKLKKAVLSKLAKDGYVQTWAGRRIQYVYNERLPEWKRHAVERKAVNALIQGSARDILHRLVFEMQPVLVEFGANILSIVHDEVIVEVDISKAEELQYRLNQVTQNRIDLLKSVPVNGDWNIGNNWLTAKG